MSSRNRGGSNKHAIPLVALKITFALYRPVILARRVVQLDPDPVTRGEVSGPHETNNGLAPIRETDKSAGRDTAHGGRRYSKQVASDAIEREAEAREFPRRFIWSSVSFDVTSLT